MSSIFTDEEKSPFQRSTIPAFSNKLLDFPSYANINPTAAPLLVRRCATPQCPTQPPNDSSFCSLCEEAARHKREARTISFWEKLRRKVAGR